MMKSLNRQQMVSVDGGGIGTWCGVAVGFTIVSFGFSRLLGAYLLSKAIGVCAIDAAT